MSKFLEILEQHDPANQSKMDAAFQAKFFLYEQEVPFSSEGSKIILHAEQGDIILEAIGMQARQVADEEEQTDGSYDVDREVEKLGNKANSGLKGLAAKGLGTAPQKAKSSVKKRNNVASKALRVYDDTTKNLERQVSQAQSQIRNIRA